MFRPTLFVCCALLAGIAGVADTSATVHKTPGYSNHLPAPLNTDWTRGDAVTGPADQTVFGGGVSTTAEYTNNKTSCRVRITFTGDAPNMQSFSMNFSNPAAAGLTGARLDYVNKVPIVVTADGEVQALTNNILTQFGGDCPHRDKVAYVANTDFDRLRASFAGRRETTTALVRSPQDGVTWEGVYGGAAKDWAYALTATAEGGLVVAGRTASKGAGLEDVWVLRLNSEGELLWDKTYGGAGIDRARAVIETRDRHLIVAGATESRGAGEFDAWVIKLDSAGEIVWDWHGGHAATDWASSIVETQDSGYAVAGYTQNARDAPYDVWVFKLSAEGKPLWQHRYGGEQTDWANAITETISGQLVLVGHTESSGAGGADFLAMYLNARGVLMRERTVGSGAMDYASTVTASQDGGVIVGGMIASADTGKMDGYAFKLNADAELVWDTTVGGTEDDWLRAVLETDDGYRLAGYTNSTGSGRYDGWVVRLDREGEFVSQQTFGAAANEWVRAMVQLPDGGFAIAGDNYSKGAGEGDVWVVRLDAGN